jgi:hypothetical protein
MNQCKDMQCIQVHQTTDIVTYDSYTTDTTDQIWTSQAVHIASRGLLISATRPIRIASFACNIHIIVHNSHNYLHTSHVLFA